MQYFGRAIGSVSKTWNSINPATLSGAIDVIVVENEDGERHCSPFHVRFGKFQLFRPSQKKVDFIVNGEVTDIPMKLNDEGEAFFVFETDGYVPEYLQTSPVVSAVSSPGESPRLKPNPTNGEDLEYLDIGEGLADSNLLTPQGGKAENHDSVSISSSIQSTRMGSMSPIERARSITMKLNIPSRVEANGDIFLDMHGYKSDKQDVHDTDVLVKQLLEEEFGENVDVDAMMNTDMEGNIRILNSESSVYGSSNSPNSTTSVASPTSATSSASATSPTSVDSTTPAASTALLPSSMPSNQDENGSNRAIAHDITSMSTENKISVPPPQPRSSIDGLSTVPKVESSTEATTKEGDKGNNEDMNKHNVHFKTLRLTPEQLKFLSLNYGENDITYSVNNGKSVVTCKLFLWKRSTPIVISDIDGTITKSDALGHVLTMLGRDWTHDGVAKLFDDIEFNGYNIMYLTARSVGLADTTRSYLQGVEQGGYKLPSGPVILSPDRTIAALRREIVLKKPEVFKMACLNDIRTLYYPDKINPLDHEKHQLLYDFEEEAKNSEGNEVASDLGSDEFTDINTNTNPQLENISREEANQLNTVVDESNTPFYAGFGNRITDAISYRSVGVPSSRIFTINPDGDVKMELLEMAGYKSSYVSIVELVDQFFPPVELANESAHSPSADSKLSGVGGVCGKNMSLGNAKNRYTDFNYWRSPDIDLSLISDSESDGDYIYGSDNNKGNDKETNEESKVETQSHVVGENQERDGDGEDVRSIGSRFSIFLRSPLSSPRREKGGEEAREANPDEEAQTAIAEEKRVNDGRENIQERLVRESELLKDGQECHDKDSDIDGDNGNVNDNTNDYNDEDDEDDESDSDYIYEASDEDEDEDEDEEDEEEEVDDTIEGSNGDSPLLDRRPSVSASVTGVSTETVNGRFV